MTKQGLDSKNVSSSDDVVTSLPVDLPQSVDMLAFGTLSSHVRVSSDLTLSNAWKVSINIKGESTEFLHVDALALAKVVVQVSNEGSPDDLQLNR